MNLRRGKDSANAKWGVKNAVMAGNYVIAHSSQLLASLKNDEATKIISRIIDDLIHGELCQLESVCSTHHARYEQDRALFYSESLKSIIRAKHYNRLE